MKTHPVRLALVAPVLTAMLGLLASNHAQAANTTWDGGGADGNFSTGLNWIDDLPATTGGTFTFTGNTNLVANNDLAFNSGTDTSFLFDASAGAFTVNGGAIRIGGVTNNSSVEQTVGASLRLNGTRTINTGTAGIRVTSLIMSTSGSSGRTATKSGSGDLTLTFANTYALMGYNVTAGRLVVANASGTFSQGAAVTLATGTELVLGQSGIGNVTGVISGAGLVRKTGSGASTLSGLNTYTGGTVVEQGVLGVASDFTMSGANALSLSELDNASIEISAGTFNYGGDLTLNFAEASFAGASYDLFDLVGGTLGAGSFGNIVLGGEYSASLNNDAGVWTGSADGLTFTFTESTGDLLVSAIPEPSSFAALAGLVGLGFAASRRRRSA